MRWRLVFSAPSACAMLRELNKRCESVVVREDGSVALKNGKTMPGFRVRERSHRWQLERREEHDS